MNFDTNAKLIYEAIKFADQKHKGQTRKASGSPYIVHPIMVSYFVANFKKSKNFSNLVAASILHDVVEDCDIKPEIITKKFGMMVSSIVFELTDDKEKIKTLGKLEYQKQKMIGLSSYALIIKLCDRLCNLMDSPSEKSIEQTKEIIEHLKKNRKLSKSHKNIIQQIETVLN